jgi:hypothetical protein
VSSCDLTRFSARTLLVYEFLTNWLLTGSNECGLRQPMENSCDDLNATPARDISSTRLEGFSDGVMWANFHLLFWLSLVPVVTAWVGSHALSRWPAVTYGAVGFMAGVAYYVLTLTILNVNNDTRISELWGRDTKGKVSIALYTLDIALDFIEPLLAYAAYALVSIMWFIPDHRLAKSGDDQR